MKTKKVKVFKVKKSALIKWVYESGYDQGIKESILSLGYSVVESLAKNGTFSITAKDVLNECELSYMPMSIIKGHKNSDLELGDFEGEYKIKLIKG